MSYWYDFPHNNIEYHEMKSDINILFDIIFKIRQNYEEGLSEFYSIYLKKQITILGVESKKNFMRRALKELSLIELSEIVPIDMIYDYLIGEDLSKFNKNDVYAVIKLMKPEESLEIISSKMSLSKKQKYSFIKDHILKEEVGTPVFDSVVGRKTTCRSKLYNIFFSHCSNEKDFDFWVGKKKIRGSGVLMTKIRNDDDIEYFRKIVNCGVSYVFSFGKDVKNIDSLEKMVDILGEIKHYKTNPSITTVIRKITNIFENEIEITEECKERMRFIPFKINKIRKGTAYTFANKLNCDEFKSYKKL